MIAMQAPTFWRSSLRTQKPEVDIYLARSTTCAQFSSWTPPPARTVISRAASRAEFWRTSTKSGSFSSAIAFFLLQFRLKALDDEVAHRCRKRGNDVLRFLPSDQLVVIVGLESDTDGRERSRH